MKLPPTKYLLAGSLGLLLLTLGWWGGGIRPVRPVKVEVSLLSVASDPMHYPVKRATVLNGITTLSAIFMVTNSSPEAVVWFDTCAVEQNVAGQWRRTPVENYAGRRLYQLKHEGKGWNAVASEDVYKPYLPGSCWNFVVAWPPDLPTNAVWRLELHYARRPSPRLVRLDALLGVHVFARRGKEQVLFTPEVKL